MSGSSVAIDIDRISGSDRTQRADAVAVEEPLEIQLCAASAAGAAAKSVAITMRTPGHDVELALGFLHSESILEDPDDVVNAECVGSPDPVTGVPNTVRVELRHDVDLGRLERHFYTTSSCGVCGKASLDALHLVAEPPDDDGFRIRREVLTGLPDELRKRQRVFDRTGGLHAAAAFGADGELDLVREDVGRHNAVDKVVGALLMRGELPASRSGLLVSGRTSFELVQKALVAGMPMVAAVGAPSSLAVRLAREFDVTLAGFLRDGNVNVYARGDRITD